MKLGLGLYRHMLNSDHYRFARQCGATHLVIHMVDYFGGSSGRDDQPVGSGSGWGRAGDGSLWTLEELTGIRKEIESHGLQLEAVENFDPSQWHDILLDGPQKAIQTERLKQQVRIIGEAGIPVMGYNFSLAGVAGRITGPFARGGAESVGMDGSGIQEPVPNGMVWNMVYDPDAEKGEVQPVSHAELWDRLRFFLSEILPAAEEAGVRMAAHPDDPPLPRVRGLPRLVYQPSMYQDLLDLVPSPSNCLEFCLGTLAEMTEGDVYEATDHYSRQGKLAYVHFRNVKGKVPEYREVFIDEGDIDMLRILEILHRNDYQGVLIPDHTPRMTSAAPWHTGMAYAMGYMKAALQQLERTS